jgi:hypothetical protein
MAYTTDWKNTGSTERWRVDWVDTAKITGGEIAVGDLLTFEGIGKKTDSASILKYKRLGTTATWGTGCDHTGGPPETVTLEHASLGTCNFKRSSSPTVKLRGYKGPPTGAAWTAEEYKP